MKFEFYQQKTGREEHRQCWIKMFILGVKHKNLICKKKVPEIGGRKSGTLGQSQIFVNQ